jgi:DNA-binding IclR family transcriptional regulator
LDEDAVKNTSTHKTLDILLLFRDQRRQISIDEISQRLDLPKSTTYRYVKILSEKGFLERAGANSYRLGLTFLELSKTALDSNRDLRLTALPSMKRVAESVGESVSLMRVFNGQVICIESIEGVHALRVKIEQGRVQPLHAGASSKVLLAYMSEAEQESYLQAALPRITGHTITDKDSLKAHLQEIRDQGFSVSDGEIDVGARAISVPIKNGRNEVVAALSIEGPSSRMDDNVIAGYLDLLLEEAAHIQHEFR